MILLYPIFRLKSRKTLILRIVGFEPTHLTAQEPKSCMSANSIISARYIRHRLYYTIFPSSSQQEFEINNFPVIHAAVFPDVFLDISRDTDYSKIMITVRHSARTGFCYIFCFSVCSPQIQTGKRGHMGDKLPFQAKNH